MTEDSIQPVKEKQQSNGDAVQPQETAPPVVAITVGKEDPPKDQHTPQEHERARKRKPLSYFEIWTIVLAAIGILVAAGTGLAIFWQARISAWTLDEIKKGGTDTHELAVAAKSQSDKMTNMADAADKIRRAADGLVAEEQRIADSSEKSIAIGNEQARANIETLRNEQRAWVSATVATWPGEGVPAVDSVFIVRATFLNTGRTPANNFHTCSTSLVLKRGEKPSSFDCRGATLASGSFAPGGLRFSDIVLGRLPKDQRDLILSDDLVVWAFGVVGYDDAFGRTHSTEFCFRLLSGGGYAVCDEHNKME